MITQAIKCLIESLYPRNGESKPHKLLLLLAWSRLVEKGRITGNKVFYNQDLITEFSSVFSRYRSGNDRKLPHNPFFHLRTSGVWSLIPNNGKEHELIMTSAIGGPGKLRELVQCAVVSGPLLDIIKSPTLNKEFQYYVE
ncbi:MAG: hypothetical protein IKJ45_11525, partial [Kiritimatiellae bacterium]|nr:hypothetical protein [Kiritimatiellia bacterium]